MSNSNATEGQSSSSPDWLSSRGWGIARKHLPLPDIAAARGWKGTEVLQRCYLHADDETMLAVVMSAAVLREVRKA